MNGCSQEHMPEATSLMGSKVQDMRNLNTHLFNLWTNNCRISCLTHTMRLVNRNVNRILVLNFENKQKSIEYGSGLTSV